MRKLNIIGVKIRPIDFSSTKVSKFSFTKKILNTSLNGVKLLEKNFNLPFQQHSHQRNVSTKLRRLNDVRVSQHKSNLNRESYPTNRKNEITRKNLRFMKS